MARDRSVFVRLRASVDEFKRGMKDAADSTRQVGDAAEQSSRQSEGSFSRMSQHARENREAWTQVGGALTTYGAAVTGFGAAVLGVGISYNQLRQTSVAALTTMTGSAKDANAQMDRLDDFASNSPFARDVFIRAQQQLLGFGEEAERVVPILDAVQNAVAATGGSNADIEELVGIIARVGATGKLTAEDLNQFGHRGVDAATIIGEQMGKTGATIREEITAGTLDADTALVALTDGMQERFGGAAENVKATFAGAADRVKAAFRDIAADFAAVLVNPQGGGLLVDGFNKLADVMRSFEDLPGPIRNTVGALALLTGPLALAAGGFFLLYPRLDESWRALGQMGRVGPAAQGAIRGVGNAAKYAAGAATIGALVLGLAKLGEHLLDTELSANEVKSRLREMGDAGASISALTDGAVDVDNFGDSLARLADESTGAKLNRGLVDLQNNLIGGVTLGAVDARAEITVLRHALADLDPVLAQIAQDSLPDAADHFQNLASMTDGSREEIAMLLGLLPEYRDHLVGVANDMGIAATDTNILKLATGDLIPEMDEAGNVIAETTEAVRTLDGEFVKTDPSVLAARAAEAQGALDELRGSVEEASRSFVDSQGAYGVAEQAAQEWAQAQADATEDVEDTWEDFVAEFEGSTDAYLAELARMQEAQDEWESNLLGLIARGVPAEFVNHLAEMGPAAADEVALIASMTDDELAEWVSIMEARSGEGSRAFADNLTSPDVLAVLAAAGEQLGQEALDGLVDKLASGQITAQEAIDEYDLDLEIELGFDPVKAHEKRQELESVFYRPIEATLLTDTTEALRGLFGFRAEAEETTATATLDADGSEAEGTRTWWSDLVDATIATAEMHANPDDANEKTATWERLTNLTVGTSTLEADSRPALGGLSAWKNASDLTVGTAMLDATSRLADGVRDTFVRSVERSDPTADLKLRQQDARDSFNRFISEMSGKTISVSVAAKVSQIGSGIYRIANNADGGFYQYANGGIDQAGQHVPRQSMMGGPQYGRTNILWGEPETGWEAYISGKPGQEARNRAVLEEAAHRMGMTVLDGLGTQKFANGGVIPTNVNLTGGYPTGTSIDDMVSTWADHNLRAVLDKQTGTFRDLWQMVQPWGVSLYSAFRPGAITATGKLSKHAQGKAIDVSNNRALWNFLEAQKSNFAELYGPWGLWLRGMNRYNLPGAGITARNHRDHIHIAAYENGGMLDAMSRPKVADTGRLTLDEGWNAVYNGLGRLEHLTEQRFTNAPAYVPAQSVTAGAGGPVTAELSPRAEATLMAVAQRAVRVELDGREFGRKVAEVNNGRGYTR